MLTDSLVNKNFPLATIADLQRRDSLQGIEPAVELQE
jgi:hypothetical protein